MTLHSTRIVSVYSIPWAVITVVSNDMLRHAMPAMPGSSVSAASAALIDLHCVASPVKPIAAERSSERPGAMAAMHEDELPDEIECGEGTDARTELQGSTDSLAHAQL
jgi:hypothetical protein